MHLLAATPGSIDDGKEPVDLGQTPADVVIISAADYRTRSAFRCARPARKPTNTPPCVDDALDAPNVS